MPNPRLEHRILPSSLIAMRVDEYLIEKVDEERGLVKKNSIASNIPTDEKENTNNLPRSLPEHWKTCFGLILYFLVGNGHLILSPFDFGDITISFLIGAGFISSIVWRPKTLYIKLLIFSYTPLNIFSCLLFSRLNNHDFSFHLKGIARKNHFGLIFTLFHCV